MTTNTGANFIPEIWSDEVVATYKSNLVAANLVRNLNHSGKKGDSIHIPQPGRSSASLKLSDSNVTAITDTAADILVSIDKHYEWSMYIEDIANMQALASMRKFYTDDAGYALARQVDTDLINQMKASSSAATTNASASNPAVGETVTIVALGTGGDWKKIGAKANKVGEVFTVTKVFVDTAGGLPSGGTLKLAHAGSTDVTVSASKSWDTGILEGLESLNDNDTPMNDRSLLVSPSAYTALLSTDRFTEQAFIGNGNAIATGKVGQIYGVDVFVSSNVGTGATEQGLLFQKDALVLATQQSVRTQTQYKQEMLADLFTADTVYGTKVIRPNSIVHIATA